RCRNLQGSRRSGAAVENADRPFLAREKLPRQKSARSGAVCGKLIRMELVSRRASMEKQRRPRFFYPREQEFPIVYKDAIQRLSKASVLMVSAVSCLQNSHGYVGRRSQQMPLRLIVSDGVLLLQLP